MSRATWQSIFDSGYIKAGDVLVFVCRGELKNALVVEGGKIVYGGQKYARPSAAWASMQVFFILSSREFFIVS